MIELKYGKRKVVNYRGAKMVVGGLTSRNKIDILLYINTELANIRHETELFDRVLTLAQEIFEPDNITIRLFDGEYLNPVRFLHETKPPRRPLLMGEGYSGQALEQVRTLNISDLSKHPDLVNGPETTKAILTSPIMFLDRPIGTIAIESDTPYFYKEDDREILEAMAAQLAQSLTNVRLIEGLEAAREEQAKVQQQLEFDLRMGRNVQRQIVPEESEPWHSVSFKSFYEPMVEVSGDYFNIIRRGDFLTMVIVDVSGHGVPAALITVALHYHFYTAVAHGLGLLEILEEVSEAVSPLMPDGTYFTAQLIRIYSDHSFSFVNCGHHKLIHFRESGERFELLDTPGYPIGILPFEQSNYEERFGHLEPGDALFLLTDGLTEQRDDKGEEIGTEQLLSWLSEDFRAVKSNTGLPDAGKVFDSFLHRFRQRTGDAKIEDDLTLAMAQLNPRYQEATLHYNEGRALYQKGNYNAALKKARQVEELDPYHRGNLLLMTNLCHRQRLVHEARDYLERYLSSTERRSPELFYKSGWLFFQLKDYREAKRRFKKAWSLDNSFVRAAVALARVYLKEHSVDKAYRALSRAHSVSPKDQAVNSLWAQLDRLSPKSRENTPSQDKLRENIY